MRKGNEDEKEDVEVLVINAHSSGKQNSFLLIEINFTFRAFLKEASFLFDLKMFSDTLRLNQRENLSNETFLPFIKRGRDSLSSIHWHFI